MFRPPARQLLALLAVLSGGLGQPILPSLSYPVFILTPPDVLKTKAGQGFQPIPPTQLHFPGVGLPPAGTQHHYPTVSDTAFPQPPEPGYEVTQFHSQDELGRVVYGFHGPDQSRMEARSMDGTVRGSYSYVDPNGNIVRMQYWDDGSGFHVTGNALPNGYPAYTPEVAAARAQHLKYYQAALQAAEQMPSKPIMGDGSDGTDHPSDSDHPFDYNVPQFDKDTNTNNLFNEDSDSVSLDNPELFGNFNYQEEEKKTEDKPSSTSVEGEVELGEDVGPDEDENEEQQEQNFFRKDKNVKKDNEENKGPKGNTQFKVVVGSDVPKKFFNKEQAHHEKEEEEEIKNEENTDNGDVHDDDDVSHENEDVSHENEEDQDDGHHGDHDEEEEHNDENHEEDNDNNNDEEKHEDDETHDNEDGNVEEGVDEQFDTVEHLFNPPDVYSGENYRRNGFGERIGNTKQEEEGYYNSAEENDDAETAENRKSQASHVKDGSVTGGMVALQGSPIDQLIDRSMINKFLFQPKGFFYHYLHTIPKPAERIDLLENSAGLAATNPMQNLQQRSFGEQPALIRSSNLPEVAPSPAVAQGPTIKQPQLDSVQQSSNLIRQISRRQPVTLLQPFTEVHEPQVSPEQAAANPKLYPVYVHEKVR